MCGRERTGGGKCGHHVVFSFSAEPDGRVAGKEGWQEGRAGCAGWGGEGARQLRARHHTVDVRQEDRWRAGRACRTVAVRQGIIFANKIFKDGYYCKYETKRHQYDQKFTSQYLCVSHTLYFDVIFFFREHPRNSTLLLIIEPSQESQIKL